MNLSLTGLPAIIVFVGFVVVLAAPVWLAARVVGADHPTLLHALAALAVGLLGSFAMAVLTGPWVLLLAPLAFLFAFKYVLGTSWLGSVLLAVVAGAGYAAMGHFVGGSFTGAPAGINV